jgi:putative flavoprotein involved in K+ transport
MGTPPDAGIEASLYSHLKREVTMNTAYESKRIQTLVIGGGQAGLSVGYYLAKRGMSFLIIDANQRIGDAWRNRWDSLRLFSPARYDGLPGLAFPGPGDRFPTKDDMADYLQTYAKHFQLPVRNGIKVDTLTKEGDRFVATAGNRRFEAENVVVAMANYQTPQTPAFAGDLDKGIVQLTAHEYRNPSQLQDGGVLIVGAGNSGADIGVEVARTHKTWMSGKESGHIPWDIESFIARYFFIRVMRFIGHHILNVSTPIGRKARPKMLFQAAPLVRVKPWSLINAGIERVPRVVGVKDGLPLLADNRTLDVKNVIWCTGYHHSFPWIKIPVFGEDGLPLHERGVVAQMPGLYFVGLHFLYSMTSSTLFGIGRDANHVVKAIHSRLRARKRQTVGRLQQVEVS